MQKKGLSYTLPPERSESNKRPLGDEKGFSLLEILIGLIFLAIGLLAMASLQITSIHGTSFSYHLNQATYLAQSGLEDLRNLPFEDAKLTAGRHRPEDATLAGTVFRRTYTVKDNATTAGTLKAIIYNVEWNDGGEHKVSFSTGRYAKREP
jgi:Tfp pilus assembly protein PilV